MNEVDREIEVGKKWDEEEKSWNHSSQNCVEISSGNS